MSKISLQKVPLLFNFSISPSRIPILKNWKLLVFVLLLLSSCSTKKNTFSRRTYHNLTAHYNGWWNGNESLKTGVDLLNKEVIEDYSTTLSVFNYGNKKEASMLIPNMDRAIEKASITAQKHSMWFRNREYCNWIDDSYLLIGKANFYKQEYTIARQSFNYVLSRFYYTSLKSESQLWLAKTYIETGNFLKAEELLNEIALLFPEEQTAFVRKNLDLVYADLYLKSNQDTKAIAYLEKALELPINRKTIARISYILAQLYQKEEKTDFASNYYQKVVKINSNYQMAFNAKINLAYLYTSKSSQGASLRKSLNKMLKDSKNKNYLDQIHFALAEIDLIEQDTLTAVKHLKAAVKNSRQNLKQKSIASLKLADLLFKKNHFSLAHKYYDTAQQTLPTTSENYLATAKQLSIYFELSKQLSIVEQQDSLLYLARLPESKLNDLADSLISLLKEKETQKRNDENIAQQNSAIGNQIRNTPGPMGMGTALGGGQWYFYNPQARSLGYTEFLAKWGNRPFADNWRLSNKQQNQSTSFAITENGDDKDFKNDSSTNETESNPNSRAYYLKEIPRTEAQKKEANLKIADALYQAAFIYKEELKKNEKARAVFEEFASRTNNHSLQLQVYFQLYQLYDEPLFAQQKNKYKQLIIDNYADTDYALLVQNPDYYREMEKKQNFFSEQYDRAYQAFEQKQYLLALHLSNQAINKPENHPLKANFLFIKAMSMAQTNVMDSMYRTLELLVDKYPDAAIAPLAKTVLSEEGIAFSSEGKTASTDVSKEEAMEKAAELYTLNPDSKHFVLLVLDAEKINVSAIQVRIQDFNKKQNSSLRLTNYPLLDQQYIIAIGEFRNQTDAMTYYRAFQSDQYVFPQLIRNDSKTFVISAENYSRFFIDKDINKYQLFFNNKYFN